MQDIDILIESVSKTEGHAGLEIKVRNNKTEKVNFKIVENKRFYTQAIKGKNFVAAPQLMSRICGTCSIAHLLCCIKACENALRVRETIQTKLLRELTMHGLMIRDHALHLYMFSLPDILGKDSILELNEKNPKEKKLLEDTFIVKSAGNHLCKAISGRAVHPPFPTIGGFARIPDKNLFSELKKKLVSARQPIIDLIQLYSEESDVFERKTVFVALAGEKYDYLSGEIMTSSGLCIPRNLFEKHLIHVVLPYSQASAYKFDFKPYFVGSLARLNLLKKKLEKETRNEVGGILKKFPSINIFYNNLAQAIEVLHSIDASLKILDELELKQEPLQKPEKKQGTGIAVIEAPRGTLYYYLDIDFLGVIRNAKIVVPTGQNQVNIEQDIAKLVEDNLDMNKQKLVFEIEKLIRAYDPCMSCASHFLKVKWI